jgi:hypothetical protein
MVRFCFILLAVSALISLDAADSGNMRTIAKGAFSGIRTPFNTLVTNDVQWTEVWGKHSANEKQVEAVPKIDFNKESVILVAMGEKRTGGYAIEVFAVEDSADSYVVRVRTKAPRPGGFQLQALSAPFHIVAVPKISKPVHFKLEAIEGNDR